MCVCVWGGGGLVGCVCVCVCVCVCTNSKNNWHIKGERMIEKTKQQIAYRKLTDT